jgi:hypothetical protein
LSRFAQIFYELLKPFFGATRRGVEHIQAFIKEGASKERAAIDTAVKENGKTIVDIVHPAESGFQASWEIAAEQRKLWLRSDKGDVKMLGSLLVFSTFSLPPVIGLQMRAASPNSSTRKSPDNPGGDTCPAVRRNP